MDKSNYQYTEEDYLEVDASLPGQSFVCLSFISPEKVLKRKDLYFAKHFLHDVLSDEMKRADIMLMRDFMQSILNNPEKKEEIITSNDYSLERLGGMYIDFLNKNKERLQASRLSYEKVDDLYQSFLINNEDKLAESFNKEVDFQTNVRGIKVRGVYETRREAEKRAEFLRKRDKNFSVFVGQCGYWLPWSPDESKVQDQEYAEKELNELMKKYNENQSNRDNFYSEEKQSKVEQARRENEEKKKKLMEETKSTQPSTEESTKKVEELRKIVDEKSHVFSDIKAKDEAVIGDAKENQAIFQTEDAWLSRKLQLEREKEAQLVKKEKQEEVKTGKKEEDKKINEVITKIL